jgi:hypothetical protein
LRKAKVKMWMARVSDDGEKNQTLCRGREVFMLLGDVPASSCIPLHALPGLHAP